MCVFSHHFKGSDCEATTSSPNCVFLLVPPGERWSFAAQVDVCAASDTVRRIVTFNTESGNLWKPEASSGQTQRTVLFPLIASRKK